MQKCGETMSGIYNIFLLLILQIIFCQLHQCPHGMNTKKLIFTWDGMDTCKICGGNFACSDSSEHWREGITSFQNPVGNEKVWTLYGDLFFQLDTCNIVMNNITFKLNGKMVLFLLIFRIRDCCCK